MIAGFVVPAVGSWTESSGDDVSVLRTRGTASGSDDHALAHARDPAALG